MSKYRQIKEYIEWGKERYKCSPIFEIWLFEKPNNEMIYHKPEGDIKSGFPDTGCFDYIGFYYELNTAIQAMNENWCDIQDAYYYAGFILCRFPGLYDCAGDNQRMYFLWDNERQGFFEAEEPEIFKHIAY